ncbi:MAG: sulfatase-like hydrolase/transferase, partial [Planctomycetota bacterium]
AIAMRGVTFERFYTFPLCSPTREALWHGEYPRRSGVGSTVKPLDGETQPTDRLSLAEALGMPSLLVGKYHLGRSEVLPASLTSGALADGIERWLAGSPESVNRPTGATHRNWYRVDDATEDQHESTYTTDAQLAAWQSSWNGGLGILSWSAPHAPYDTPPGMKTGANTRAKYERSIQYLDGAVAAVLAGIDWNTTLVIFLGDNGTPNDARPLGAPAGQWKNTTMEGGVRVPLLVAGAGVTQACVTSHRLVSALDIAATVLTLTGRDAPRGFRDSVSFADELGPWSGAPARSWAFAERYDPSGGPDDMAVVTCEWKLRVYDFDPTDLSPATTTLYHLPDQTAYAPGDYPAVRDELLGYLASIPARQ